MPIEHCEALGFEPGDDVAILAANGVLTVIKKQPGAARGLLTKVRGNKRISDRDSLRSSL